MTLTRLALLGGFLLLGVAPTVSAADAPTAAPMSAPMSAPVMIDNFTFSPPELTVAPGTRVVWTNRDDIPHIVTGQEDPRAMHSPPLDTGDTFSMTFDKSGTFRYFCSLHPFMQGTVVVR